MDEIVFKLGVFLLMMVVGGFGVKRFMVWLRDKQLEVPPISEDQKIQDAWKTLILRTDKSGVWIGHFERLIFFGVLLFLPVKDAPAAIGVWLVFKIAAKWEAWNHMAHIPETIDHVDPLKLAVARRIWAAQGYATLVIGTTVNILLAAGAAALAHYGWHWITCR